jgi:hypothetical protein
MDKQKTLGKGVIMSKKKKQISNKNKNKNSNLVWLVGGTALLIGLVLVLMLRAAGDQAPKDEHTHSDGTDGHEEHKTESVTMEHMHGLGYTDDGEVVAATHLGLKYYKEGKWRNGKGEPNDYMGFSVVDDGFYSSGHPGEGVDRPNPLGVVKNNFEGTELKSLAFEGEVDFHTFSAGHETHTLFAVAHEKNDEMDSAGLFYSVDEAKTWNKSEAKGIEEEILAVTVHPTLEKVAAAATKNAVYITEDFGASFKKVLDAPQITAVYWGVDGTLYAGSYDDKATLSKVPYGETAAEEVAIPELKEDAVMYIAQHHKEKRLSIATYNGDIYEQDNDGKWMKIAEDGKGIE